MPIRREWLWAWILCLPLGLAAQSILPSGTIIPISMDNSIHVKKAYAGEQIRSTVTQNVPGTPIHRGACVLGHVVQVTAQKSGPVRLEIRFDAVKMHKRTIPLNASLRALASFLEVQEAQIPVDGVSRGMTPETWDTEQIGGDQVYRGGGPVAVGEMVVGEPTPWGVLAYPRTKVGMPCRGVVGQANKPQAMWLFSSDACGVYGFANLRIEHAGRADPEGAILLESTDNKLSLMSGSGMLLRVF
jgi:hypothetical protein